MRALLILALVAGAAFAQDVTSTNTPPAGCGPLTSQATLPDNTVYECDATGCTVRCRPGYFRTRPAPQMAYQCVDGVWVPGSQDISCPPVDCGLPVLEGTLKEYVSCSSTTFNSTCTLRCSIGNEPRTPQALLCAEDAKWVVADGANLVKCVDQDGCANSPCASTVSVCVDIPAPQIGYTCKCAPGYSGDEASVSTDGKGCVRMGVETKDGSLNIKVGQGKTITFQRGDRVDSIASIVDRLTRAEAMSRDIAAVNQRVSGVEANVLQQDTSLAARITDNANGIARNGAAIESVAVSVSNLVGPTGQVNINKQSISSLQASIANILAANGPIASETSRATAAENSIAASVTTLSTRVNGVDTAGQSTATRVSALQTQLTSEISRATSVENSLAAGAVTTSTRVSTLEVSQASTALRLTSVDTAQQSSATRLASLDTSYQSTVARVNTIDSNVNAEVNRATTTESSLAVSVDDVRRAVSGITCASPSSVSALDTKYTATEATNLNNILQVVCSLNNAIYIPQSSTTRCFRLGEDANYAATSCVQLRDTTAHGKTSGVYFINYSGTVARTYCDQTTESGGWELLMKIRGDTNVMGYDSAYWKTTATYRDTDFDPNLWEDAKYASFNVGRFSNIRVRWNDQGTGLTWTEPVGWSNGVSPLTYFTTERIMNQVLVNNDATHTGWMEWANMGSRFSDQVCAKKRVIAHCSPSGHCCRWGLHYNNECDFASNDVMNGLGMNVGGRSAGDYIGCCTWRTGVNRPMNAMIWGRI